MSIRQSCPERWLDNLFILGAFHAVSKVLGMLVLAVADNYHLGATLKNFIGAGSLANEKKFFDTSPAKAVKIFRPECGRRPRR